MGRHKQVKKVFKAKKGFGFNDREAEMFGERIDELISGLDRAVTPEDIVEDAKSPRSVFHKYLDWDDARAGQRWRREQARKILQSIDVEIIYDGEKRRTRAYVNVTDPSDVDRGLVYVDVDRALTEKDLRAQVLRNALDEVQGWTERYHTYKELVTIFVAVEKTAQKLRSKLQEKDGGRGVVEA